MEAILKKEIILDKVSCRILGILTFVILTTLGAFVRIPLPFTPVPITLQTFFVLLSGAFLGRSLGMVTQTTYVFLGILGLPIFTGAGSGTVYLFGPTGGYLLGFILAAFWLGNAPDCFRNNFLWTLVSICVADFILLSCGTIWLKFIFGYPLGKTLLIGFLPFIPGDLFKAAAAAFIYVKLKARLREIF